MIAYDLETTRIKAGTPRPLYITAYGDGFEIAGAVRDMAHLTAILRAQFLTDDTRGCTFVAWNANRFDAFIIAAALLREPDLTIYPYMTRSKVLRGLRIVRREDAHNRNAKGWEFCDGIAMLGLAGVSLDKFLATFAPAFPKLAGAVDFEREEFDPDNPDHCAYAFRDSEGLYHGMMRAQSIMLEHFSEPLSVTMGAACIRIFAAHIPEGVKVAPLIPDLREIVSSFVMRGGFCYCNKRYRGPIWKYDINQAYAAAMREAALPCGEPWHGAAPPGKSLPGIHRITATNPRNKIPFYCRAYNERGRLSSIFALHEIPETWVTSIELEQLRAEGWTVRVLDSWVWSQSFSMVDYVDRLERLRTTCEGGPGGAIGTMVKATGNHSYGKTVEQIEPVQFVLSADCPEGYLPWYGDGSDPIEHIYYAIDDDRKPKDYHQPHIGAFITAHVRMVLRRAALLDPDAWLYADTDCIVFSRDMTAKLDIDSKRYGAWKVEESGTPYLIIAKKVYSQIGGEKPKRSAKGLHVKKLDASDFEQWFDGAPPVQVQDQLQNFLAVMRGADMFREQRREGTRVESAILES